MELNNLNLPDGQRSQLEQLLNKAYRNYTDDLQNLTDAATDEIEAAYTRSPDELKAVIQDYARSASQLANDYYDLIRLAWKQAAGVDMPDFAHGGPIDPDRVLWQVQGGFNNTDYNGLTYTQVKNGQSKAGATIDDLWPSFDNVDDWQQFIADMILSATRLTQQRNMRLDPTDPRWARVPHGKTCAFCAMLASRGFAYLSAESAGLGNSYHDDCRCSVIPSWGAQALEGYDPDAYYDMYTAGKQAAGENGGIKDALAQMRRLNPDRLTDGVTAKPGIRWSHKAITPNPDELERLADMTVRMQNDRYTSEEKTDALRTWTGNSYRQINAALFSGDELPENITHLVDVIDEAIADHITQQRFTVDRLMQIETFGITSLGELKTLKKAQQFDHAGYMATSIDVGGKPAGGGTRVATRILVPPGSHGAYLKNISNFASENEILLKRGSRLVFDGLGKENGQPMIYVKLLE